MCLATPERVHCSPVKNSHPLPFNKQAKQSQILGYCENIQISDLILYCQSVELNKNLDQNYKIYLAIM